MIPALDSSFDAPTPAQAQAAAAAGVRAWGGYLATEQRAGAFNLAAPWSRQAFAIVQQAGLRAIAFCSGWDDPVVLRQLAAEWGLLLFLDDEDRIRRLTQPDWRPAFLQASGAGLYGLLSRHNIAAPYRIAAEYPTGGCTGATWPTSPAPPEPHGWQCQGTHTEFGLSVDRSALDDWFQEATMAIDPAILQELRTNAATSARIVSATDAAQDDAGNPIDVHWTAGYVLAHVRALQAQLGQLLGDDQQVQQAVAALTQQVQSQGATVQAVQAAVAALKDQLAAGGDPGAAAAIDRIEQALQKA